MDRTELEDLLLKAEAAGDEASARIFAEELSALDAKMPAEGVQQPAAAQPTTQPAGRDPRAEYEAMPGWQKPFVAASDVARLAGSGVGMGYSEKALAKIQELVGGNYEEALAAERQATADARARTGSAAPLASALGPLGASRAIPSLVGAGTQGLNWVQRLIGSAAAGGIEGGIYGGIEATGNDRKFSEGAKTGAAFGAGAGGIGEAVSSLIGRFSNPRTQTPAAPTMDDLRYQSQDLRDEVANRNVYIHPEAIADLNDTLRRNMGTQAPQGARAGSHPKTIAELNRLEEYSPSVQAPVERASRTVTTADGTRTSTTSRNNNPPRTNTTDFVTSGDVERTSRTSNMNPDRGMSLYDLDQHRRTAQRNTRSTLDESDRGMGGRMIEGMDRFASGLNSTNTTAGRGTTQEAVGMLEQARGLDHRRLKAKEVGSMVRDAERRSASGNTTSADGDQLRGSIANFLKDERKTQGYTPDELSMLEGVVSGSDKANRWKRVGELANGYGGLVVGGGLGGGLGSMLGGPTVGGIMGAAGAVGSKVAARGATKLAAKETNRQADELLDTIMRGGGRPRPLPRQPGMSRKDAASFRRALTILGIDDATND